MSFLSCLHRGVMVRFPRFIGWGGEETVTRDWRRYAAAATVLVAAQFALPVGPARTTAHLLLHGGATAVLVVGVLRHRPPVLQPWMLLGVGVALTAAGRAAHLAGTVTGSLARLELLLTVLPITATGCATAAAVWFVLARRPGRGADGLLDGAMVLLTAVLVAAGGLLTAGSRPAHVVAVAGAALALTMLVVGARLTVRTTAVPPSLVALLLAATCLLAFNLLRIRYGPAPPALPRWADVTILGSTLLVGWAALHPSMVTLTEPEQSIPGDVGPMKLLLMGWALLVGPLLMLVRPDDDLRVTLAAGTALLVGLVLARIGLVVRQRERTQAAFERSEARYRALLRHAFDAVVVLRGDGTVSYASAAVTRMLGRSPAGLVGESITGIADPGDAGELHRCLEAARRSPSGVVPTEVRLGGVVDGYRWVEVFLVNGLHDESIGGIVMGLRDITDRKSNELALSRLATSDSLTGLPNRHALLAELTAVLDRPQAPPAAAVLFADLDGFKEVNDTYGHAAGDRLLVKVARRLLGALRPGHLLARFGGDEFVVLAPGVSDEAAAIAIGRGLRQALRTPIAVAGVELSVDVTVGVAVSSTLAAARGAPVTAEELLEAADAAMYRAKREGRHLAGLGAGAATIGRVWPV